MPFAASWRTELAGWQERPLKPSLASSFRLAAEILPQELLSFESTASSVSNLPAPHGRVLV
jgi:hypothetical protein